MNWEEGGGETGNDVDDGGGGGGDDSDDDDDVIRTCIGKAAWTAIASLQRSTWPSGSRKPPE
jgi:hypothetical protein